MCTFLPFEHNTYYIFSFRWMAQAQYSQDYLYTTPDECCSKHYPSVSSCPLGPDDGVQEGKYWQSDVYFYPNWKGSWCNFGNDYPQWMASKENRDNLLFETAADCCSSWFSDQQIDCEFKVIATADGKPIDGYTEAEEWFPLQAWPYMCVKVDEENVVPSWMLATGYKNYYVFDSRSECCKAHHCASSLFEDSK